jgi:hypothetical protein
LESLDDEETLKAAVDTTNKNNGEDFSFFSRVYYDVIDTYPRVVKILRLFLTLAAVAGVGAAFFKLVGKENDVLELTWIDAFCKYASSSSLILLFTRCSSFLPQTLQWSPARPLGMVTLRHRLALERVSRSSTFSPPP